MVLRDGLFFCFFFFFSSRRRHTRFDCDWSSDVCSSDLGEFFGQRIEEARPLIIEKLRQKGLLVRIDEKYVHTVATNSRGGGLIEPQIREQWFIDVNKKAIPWKGKKMSLKDI